MTLNCIHIFMVTGSFLYWCVMRPASQRFFIHSCIYLWILIICYLATFLGTNSLLCWCAVKQSINQSTLPAVGTNWLFCVDVPLNTNQSINPDMKLLVFIKIVLATQLVVWDLARWKGTNVLIEQVSLLDYGKVVSCQLFFFYIWIVMSLDFMLCFVKYYLPLSQFRFLFCPSKMTYLCWTQLRTINPPHRAIWNVCMQDTYWCSCNNSPHRAVWKYTGARVSLT